MTFFQLLRKNQPFTRIRFTQETVQQGKKKKRVAPQVPPASGASSVRPADTHLCQSARSVEPRSTVLGRSHFFCLTPPQTVERGSTQSLTPSQTVFHGPRYHLKCPFQSLSGRGRWSFPTCPWVENSVQQSSLSVPRFALFVQLQLTPCLQPSTFVDQLDNFKCFSFTFHHEDCVQLSRDRLNFCLKRCVHDWQS